MKTLNKHMMLQVYEKIEPRVYDLVMGLSSDHVMNQTWYQIWDQVYDHVYRQVVNRTTGESG